MTTYDSNLQIITVLLINNKLKFEIFCNSNYLRYLLQNPVIQVGATSITAILLSIIQIATYKHPNSPLTADTSKLTWFFQNQICPCPRAWVHVYQAAVAHLMLVDSWEPCQSYWVYVRNECYWYLSFSGAAATLQTWNNTRNKSKLPHKCKQNETCTSK